MRGRMPRLAARTGDARVAPPETTCDPLPTVTDVLPLVISRPLSNPVGVRRA